MRKEAWHTQRRDRASGVPLEILEHLPPKSESATFCFVLSPTPLTLRGAVPDYLSLKKRVNLQLQLIKFLGVIVFQPINSFGSPLACLWIGFSGHMWLLRASKLRGMRCSKLSKYRFLWAVKRWIRNCIGEKPFTNTISNQSFNCSKESVFRQFRTSPASHSWEALNNHMWPEKPIQAG